VVRPRCIIPQQLEPNAWATRLAVRRAAGADLIDLTDANPARTGLAPAVPEPPEAWTDGALARYEPAPRGSENARAAVARYYAERAHVVNPNSVVLTSSTSESYAHLFRLLADPGETILVPQPSYPLFVPLGRAEGVSVLTYRLAWDGRWHLDFDDLEKKIGPRTRAIVVVQPNHPTGSCLDATELSALDALAARRGLAIIADQVFIDYPWPREFRRAGTGFGAASGARDRAQEADVLPGLAGEGDALTFVLSGLSKVCGLPQMKAGWIVASGPAAAREAALVRLEWLADLFLSVSTPTQLALPSWLAARHEFQHRARARITTNLAQLAATRGRTPELTVLPADGGWVAVLQLPRRQSEEQWALDLIDLGVIVHPGHFYDFDFEPVAIVSLIVEPREFGRGLGLIEASITQA